jgi:CBS domain-containing protein
MKIRELMTNPPVSVRPDLPLRDVAATLAEHCISGVPVVSDEGRVLGVVSESDIVRKECGAIEPEPHGLRVRRRSRPHPGIAEATTAAEAMTSPAVVVEDWMSAYEAAWLMSTSDVSRLPVVRRDRLVGVISCADLVAHFARPDAEIEQEVQAAVADLDAPSRVHVEVHEGRASLDGEVSDDRDLQCVPRIAAHVPGVVAVESHLALHSPQGESGIFA